MTKVQFFENLSGHAKNIFWDLCGLLSSMVCTPHTIIMVISNLDIKSLIIIDKLT